MYEDEPKNDDKAPGYGGCYQQNEDGGWTPIQGKIPHGPRTFPDAKPRGETQSAPERIEQSPTNHGYGIKDDA